MHLVYNMSKIVGNKMKFNMHTPEIIYVEDNEIVSEAFVINWNIKKFCLPKTNNSFTIEFVGYVLSQNKVLLSFPKHFSRSDSDENNLNDMKDILSLVSLGKNNIGSFDGDEDGQFPLKSYMEILNYYKRYGLYHTRIHKERKGYKGNINWNKTIQKSTKVVSNNNILFLPFVINEKNISPIFLSECMEYVFADAYNSFSSVLDLIIPYKVTSLDNIFNDLNFVIRKLHSFKSILFKDSEKILLNNLIKYFQWKSDYHDKSNMITTHFSRYWEAMVNLYLSKSFYEINDNKITFNEEKAPYNFKKVPGVKLEPSIGSNNNNKQSITRDFKIEYDHYVKENNTIYLFDSKYSTSELKKLDYKQSFYYYHLKSENVNTDIYNGLVAPTSKSYYTKIHIDRSDIDGLKIIEHYLNVKKVINLSLRHKKDFINEILNRKTL